jgi:serine/threonine protein kinase
MAPPQRRLASRPMNVGERFLDDLSETLPILLREPPDEREVAALAEVSNCLSEDDVLSFTAGQLDAGQIRRIDEHLARCGTCSRLLTEVLGEGSDERPTQAPSPMVPVVFAPSTKVCDRFVIERLIGRGGMGEVYKAFDLQRRRTVALKTVLAARCDSRQAMARLTFELQASRRIGHPNVCRVFGTGVHRDDPCSGVRFRFLVMDYIEGESLGERLRCDGAICLSQALAIARQILLGLQAIHAAGVVHLDIKSDNVMLREDGPEPRVLLIDFGLARAALGGEPAPTYPRSPAGTVSYMAPEQLLNQPVGFHTDVFGFGVVFYELLTGLQPFAAGHGSLALAKTLRADELPLRPSLFSRALPTEVDDFVAVCTSADPATRYRDAAAALQRFDQLRS